MSLTAAAPLAVRPFTPEVRLDLCSLTGALRENGAALLQGWSDDDSWTIFLPWPEEIRALEWTGLAEWRDLVSSLESVQWVDDPFPEAPFLGGWVGFLSYELGAGEERAAFPDELPPEPPLFFARHRAGLLRSSGGLWIFAPADSIDVDEIRFRELLSRRPVAAESRRSPLPIRDSLAGAGYREKVEAIREAIARGDVYQTNLTRRFETETLDAAELYHAMTGSEPPRCSAFLRGKGWTIASASPEVFLRFDRRLGVAESRPIKGTVRREGNEEAEVRALCSSPKDAAEHLMIVDVVRNDLGKVAPAGRVSVPAFRTVRTLAHVHHLESTVRAEGLSDVTLAEMLGALLPAASITGAPKRAAVGMIRRLEPVPRGVYTGAIGYYDFRGRTELSVAIRTAVVTPDSARYHAGGGIVWESDPAAEDDESIAKSAAFLRYVRGEKG
jgi:anthranilate/para-aminobenzoate synthase component I